MFKSTNVSSFVLATISCENTLDGIVTANCPCVSGVSEYVAFLLSQSQSDFFYTSGTFASFGWKSPASQAECIWMFALYLINSYCIGCSRKARLCKHHFFLYQTHTNEHEQHSTLTSTLTHLGFTNQGCGKWGSEPGPYRTMGWSFL